MRTADFQKIELSEKQKRNVDILKILSRYGPISRPDISREMGINVVTISNYVDDFIKHNLVYEKELDISEGGRRPTLLDLNSHAGYMVGVGFNLMNMVGLLIDLKGNIITKTQIARPQPSLREITECVQEIVREVLKRSKEHVSNIKGIGIGMAGLVNKKTGAVQWPQKMGSYYTYASVDLPLRDVIEKEFNLPTLTENDATSACFGEYWLDLKRDYKNALYMFSGVGCGIMLNGEIYTGTHGYAGEVAIDNYKEKEAFDCAAAGGCMLRRWDMDLGIVADVKSQLLTAGKQAQENFLEASSGQSIESIDLKHVFNASRAKDPLACLALDTAAKRLGVKIAYMANLFDPQIVILGGGLEEAGEDFLNKVTLTMKEWAFKEIAEDLKIVYSQLRENAVALGAASLVMQKVFARLI